MPTLLLVSIDYWPEETGIGPYSTGLAEHLVRSGHDVTVLAGMPHYPQWEVVLPYRGRWRLRETRRGVHIIRRRHYVPGRQSAIRRAAYEATWLMHAGPVSPRPRPDAVIGVIPSLSGGIIARIAAARARAAYGVIVQDLVSAAAAQSGIQGGRAVAVLTRRAEAWSLRHAAVVAPVADAFRPALSAMGIPDDRIEALPNWSHLEEPSGHRDRMRERLGWAADEWVGLHAGNMGLKQGLDQVLDAGRLADREGAPVRLVLMGDGSQRRTLIEGSLGISRVEFRPFVPAAELPDVLAAADVLILSERVTVMDMSLPSKLTTYFAAGRPIVAAVHPDGASAQEVTRAGAGVTTPAGDAGSLLRAIMGVRDRADHGDALGAAGRHYAQATLGEAASFERADVIVDRLLQSTTARRRLGTKG
jgi:glycosyltransferase involved in cell wall biosynthesis